MNFTNMKKYKIYYHPDGINFITNEEYENKIIVKKTQENLFNSNIYENNKIEFDCDKSKIIYNSDGIGFPKIL